MIRAACLIIGYIFGLFQTGYLYGKKFGMDIRQHGSGNSGTTNALRVMGKKAGAIVLLGDVLKLIVACVFTTFLFGEGEFYSGDNMLWMLYTGFGVVLGHNYPFYLNFKGGKGIAATGGMLLVLDLRITLVCFIVFVATLALTRYVSLGSILVSICFLGSWVFFGQTGRLPLTPELLPESYVIVFVWAALAIWRHRSNIRRLINGTENKLGQKKE